jgi:hypothetical protein
MSKFVHYLPVTSEPSGRWRGRIAESESFLTRIDEEA